MTRENTVPAPNFLNLLSEMLTDVVFLSKYTTYSQIGDSLMSSVTQPKYEKARSASLGFFAFKSVYALNNRALVQRQGAARGIQR